MIAQVQKFQRIIQWLIVVKVSYMAILCFALELWPDEEDFDQAMRWPREGTPLFTSHLATWDGAHYLYLSEVGYEKGAPSCAFYPLWPLAIRACSVLTGGSHLVAGLVLANVFALGAWCIFYDITVRRFGETVASWALVLLIAFPGSLFYQFIYSESLFLLLAMLLWLGMERNCYPLAWIAAFLLPLTRGVGVFSVLPIGWHWLMRRRWNWLDRWRWLGRERQRMRSDRFGHRLGARWASTALLVAPVLGWVMYLGLMWMWTGNSFEGIEAQKYWDVHSVRNLWNLPKFGIGLFEATAFHEFRGSVLDRCLFMLVLYCVPVIWQLGKDMVVWTYVLGILPAMSGTFTSFTRFESCLFPLFIALAAFFTSLKRSWPLWTFVGMSAVLHVILLWRFVNFRWAG